MTIDAPLDSAAIASLSLMNALPPSALHDATALARIREAPRGSRIFDQGEPTEWAHALLTGGVRISQAGSDGNEVLIRFISPGEIFGSVAIYTDRQYPADATAIVDSTYVSWPQDELRALMHRHPQIAINMIGIIGHRLAEVQERVRELATHRTDRRVAYTLLRLLRQASHAVAGGMEIDFPLRRKDIADISGTTLHTVSRILTDWERKELLLSRNRRLVIRSIDRIRHIAENSAD
jgi:CRP-like cAMP-binding protein